MTDTTVQHTLYRFFDAADNLLYVGRTINPARRWREHEKGKDWFNDVATLKRQIYPTAEAVDAAERDAIAIERPLHNIALNGRRPTSNVRPLPPQVVAEMGDAFARRLAATGGETPIECEGDETFCECRECHDLRARELDRLHTSYNWHPAIATSVDAVEADYYAGAYLADWYYDLSDVQMFAHIGLAAESRERRPIPSFAHVEDLIAHVDCPFCGDEHRHYLAPGMSFDAPLTSGCQTLKPGHYSLEFDFLTALDERFRWGDSSRLGAKEVA